MTVEILADSLNVGTGDRLTTFLLHRFPKCLLAELNTHRMFSRNAASSRAIPVKKVIEQVSTDPFIPQWTSHQPGMQGGNNLSDRARESATHVWLSSRDATIERVEQLIELGVAKQNINRLLEPWMTVPVIVSATDWDNFWQLRCHPAAQPEFRAIAVEMRDAYNESKPIETQPGEWHIPFIAQGELGKAIDDKPFLHYLKVTTARAARCSYKTHLGEIDPEKDYELHDRLLAEQHMCYDEKTEVLTDSGWKLFEFVSKDDKLLAVDIQAGKSFFEHPSNLYISEYFGKMYQLQGQQIDLTVTPNHNMVVSQRVNSLNKWSDFRLEQAVAIAGKPRRYMKTCILDSSQRKQWVNSFGVESESFAALVGFFVGDGNAPTKNQIVFHLKKQRKIDYLHSLGIPVSTGSFDSYRITLPGIGDWFRENCYLDNQKRLPEGCLMLSEFEVFALFDGLRNSDGSKRRETWTYSTISELLKNQIQSLAHLNGLVVNSTTTINKDCKAEKCWRLNFSKRAFPRIETNQAGRSLTYSEQWIDYSGMIYCATVSTGALMVRRNEKVSVSGNSPFEHSAKALPVKVRCRNFNGFMSYRAHIEDGIPVN